MDKITVQIKCSSKTCEKLREEGLFFETIAETFEVNREDVVELND